MITFSLQSGSNGNSIYVEADGTRLLFDAGISGSMAHRRMASHGRDIRDVDAVIISHDHTDHIRSAGIFRRKFGLPIYMTKSTLRATWCNLGRLDDVHYFRSGDTLEFGSVKVHTIPTAHDAADGVAFVIEHETKKLGILTDLGHVFSGLRGVLELVDAAYLESNYDAQLLANSDYPARLKQRITGSGGHLSNHESAELVACCGQSRPKWVAVAHLSERNNRPELALASQRDAIGNDYPVYLAPRTCESELLEV